MRLVSFSSLLGEPNGGVWEGEGCRGGALCANGWKDTVHPSSDTLNMKTFVNQFAGPCFTFRKRGEREGEEEKGRGRGGILKPSNELIRGK